MNTKKIFRCSHCLNISTRPRITFDQRGWCNACQWMEEKRDINWEERQLELAALLEEHKSEYYDCLVPVSGGKDGSHVSYNLKHRYRANLLSMTVTPALSLKLGNSNLQNFIDSGYDHLQVNINPITLKEVNRMGFIMKGFPYYGWLMGIQTAVVRLALQLRIPLVFYGEDGEVEYGGDNSSRYTFSYTTDYMRRVYLEGGHDKVLSACKLSEKELYFFTFPSEEELATSKVTLTHWSYFENWNPYHNYLTAKKYCGLEEADVNNSGTFTNFAQNDQALYALHTYLMYLKFGFGRATQDAGIEIRRGAMTRQQGLALVKLYDGQFPGEYLNTYLDYYSMSREEFDGVLDKWVNRELFKKEDGMWKLIEFIE